MKDWLTDYILNAYGVAPDYPFAASPETAAFRNPGNKKWFALLMGRLPKKFLGINDDGQADILNLKCDPVMTFSLIDNQKIFRAYHMNKEHWISVPLDGPISTDELAFLVDMSYRLVEKTGKKRR